MSDESTQPPSFSHLDELGQAHMVDVGAKAATVRKAIAEGEITFSAEVLELLRDRKVPKGDIFTVSKIAGIMAAKRTADLIPLCHPLPLSQVDVKFTIREAERKVIVRAEAQTTAQTGVEMEALTAVSGALLTFYDMTKAADKRMVIGNIRLTRKEGGKSGIFVNEAAPGLADAEIEEPPASM